MKKLLFLTVTLSLFIYNANSAVYKKPSRYFLNSQNILQQQDTLAYLNNTIIKNKGKYLNKELNVLLKYLNLSIKSYAFRVRGPGMPVDEFTLYFDNSNTRSDKLHSKIKVYSIYVTFENAIPGLTVFKLALKSDREWTGEEESFYGKQIVKDIKVLNIK